MKLNFEQIRAITLGTVRMAETDNGIRMHRFTEEQEALYRQTNEEFYKKTFADVGVKLYFETDSSTLFMKVNVTAGLPRNYFSIDVSVDGKMVGHIDNFSDVDLPQDYTSLKLATGEFSRCFELGEGTKCVCVYLPWSAVVELMEVSIDDVAFVKPIKPGKKMLVYGDSITHGYDALRPSNRYAARLAEFLDAEEINKAIGGERFFPELAKLRDPIEPDYILVAYGTNDWWWRDEVEFTAKCREFYKALSSHYPHVRIFALAPIWREECTQKSKFGDFRKVKETIASIEKEFNNIVCIDCFDFVPHDTSYYADLKLHPNDKGFEYYFCNLSQSIQKYLE